jgi:hypothetical protein
MTKITCLSNGRFTSKNIMFHNEKPPPISQRGFLCLKSGAGHAHSLRENATPRSAKLAFR